MSEPNLESAEEWHKRKTAEMRASLVDNGAFEDSIAERVAASCPECGGQDWVTASDGLGMVTSVAACCVTCGYVTAAVVDLGANDSGPTQ